jgi:hypothetical protein
MLQWLFLRSLFALYQLLAYLSTSSNSKTLFWGESYKGISKMPGMGGIESGFQKPLRSGIV